MKADPTILTEINEISPLLASIQGVNVFRVPDGYFASLAEDIQETVITLDLNDLKRQSTSLQEVPEGYFENLSSDILKKIKESETLSEDESISYPSLAQCRGKNVYTLPDGYFEVLPGKIMHSIHRDAGAKVVPLFRRQVFRVAVAAAITIGLILAVFFKYQPQSDHQSFAVVNKHTVPFKDALKYNSEKAFDNGIAALTDDQIIAYLMSHGDILDNDRLIQNTNVSGMPSTTDYLANDNALDQYLKTISSGNPGQNN